MKTQWLRGILTLWVLAVLVAPPLWAECEDACQSGLSECQRNCPNSVYDSESGKTLQRTDARRLCETACSAGQSVCRRDCNWR